MKLLKTIVPVLLIIFFLPACSSENTAKKAETNFSGLVAEMFGEKAQELRDNITNIAQDSTSVSTSTDSSLINMEEGAENKEILALYQKAFGAYTTEEGLEQLVSNVLYFPAPGGGVESISFEKAEERRTNYSMTVTLYDPEEIGTTFELTGSFQFDENGKITYFRINSNKAFSQYVEKLNKDTNAK